MVLNLKKRTFKKGNEKIHLSILETRFLAIMSNNELNTYEELIIYTNSLSKLGIQVLCSRCIKKLNIKIHTVYTLGYRLDEKIYII